MAKKLVIAAALCGVAAQPAYARSSYDESCRLYVLVGFQFAYQSYINTPQNQTDNNALNALVYSIYAHHYISVAIQSNNRQLWQDAANFLNQAVNFAQASYNNTSDIYSWYAVVFLQAARDCAQQAYNNWTP